MESGENCWKDFVFHGSNFQLLLPILLSFLEYFTRYSLERVGLEIEIKSRVDSYFSIVLKSRTDEFRKKFVLSRVRHDHDGSRSMCSLRRVLVRNRNRNGLRNRRIHRRSKIDMGDIRILDPRVDPRFDLKQHRPWPPMYRNHSNPRGPSLCYRPVPFETVTQWMGPHITDYNYIPARIGAPNPNKSRDYYYLAPMYRNAMPPPAQAISPIQVSPVAVSPRMMMMERPRGRTKSSGDYGRNSVPPCTCAVGRTRSLEDVRSEMSEWEDYHDENGNNLRRNSPKGVAACRQARRSMENLLEVEVNGHHHGLHTFDRDGKNYKRHEDKRNEKAGRRRGSYMVR